MIIDFKSGEEIEVEITGDKAVIVDKPADAYCRHTSVVVSEDKREVRCRKCDAIVDPIDYIFTLYHHYDTRIDQRLEMIRQFDERERTRSEKRIKNRENRRPALMKRRQESLERAAYNEYQAKLLTIRSERQKAAAAKIDNILESKAGEEVRR